ncbi:AraC-type DNA-binding protein [Pedobacter steynii]|uniref:AraC-type DNA-binding protein n=1 Tax=Pedobacter steynii TaxID=430522 RepID=A0A1G9MNJ8_9SPHI|nr:helix-turn-helix domain-containing protein [Pedobacter steynii]NQX39545.1 AraC family transcriptional regulator [Pedobacter steynii]SDL75820.1 AraC-type DNA-binding protein [Pedobacter steynii]
MAEKSFDANLFEVEAPLNGILSHFYQFQTSATAETIVQHLSPNFEMLLVFNFGAPIRISFNQEEVGTAIILRTAAIGPLRKLLNYELAPGSHAIIANFTLNGFYRLFKIPMNELGTEEVFDLDVLIDKTCFLELWEKLAALKDLREKIQLLSTYTAQFIEPTDAASKPLLEAVPYFHNPMVQPVKAIASETNLTERSIQLRFQKYVGYSPKELLRFLRFKDVIHQMMNQRDEKLNLFELIQMHGYHDQSHLIKDFRHYLGTTPQKFLKEMLGKGFCVSKSDGHLPGEKSGLG